MEEKDIRYYIDLDLKDNKIINYDLGDRRKISQKLINPYHQRVFITKGQYNKILDKIKEIKEM